MQSNKGPVCLISVQIYTALISQWLNPSNIYNILITFIYLTLFEAGDTACSESAGGYGEQTQCVFIIHMLC